MRRVTRSVFVKSVALRRFAPPPPPPPPPPVSFVKKDKETQAPPPAPDAPPFDLPPMPSGLPALDAEVGVEAGVECAEIPFSIPPPISEAVPEPPLQGAITPCDGDAPVPPVMPPPMAPLCDEDYSSVDDSEYTVDAHQGVSADDVGAANDVSEFDVPVVDLGDLPPPPPPDDASPTFGTGTFGVPKIEIAEPGTDDAKGTLTLQMLAHVVPPFYVPLDAALAEMPGYTEEHLRDLFGGTRAVSALPVPSAGTLLRMDGGNKQTVFVDLAADDAAAARARHARYAPDTSLCEYFVPAFQRPGLWVPLFNLMTNAEPAQAARLPFTGPASSAFFLSMQHVFAVDLEAAGGPRVAIPPRRPEALTWATTPLPIVLHHVFNSVSGIGLTVAGAFHTLSPEAKAALIAAYAVEERIDCKRTGRPVPQDNPVIVNTAFLNSGDDTNPETTGNGSSDLDSDLPENVHLSTVTVGHSDGRMSAVTWRWTTAAGERMLERFVTGHSPVVGVRQSTGLVMRRSELDSVDRADLPLEEQLRIAREMGNTQTVKSVKKKMLALASPDNPLLDEANLAQAIVEFLPPDTWVFLRSLKTQLPQDIVDLLPTRNEIKFWMRHAQHFTLYEIDRAGKLALQRPHLPPPERAIRKEYTDAEAMKVVAEYLVRGPRPSSVVGTRIPLGIKDKLRIEHGGVIQFVQKHPEHFTVVLKGPDLRKALISLVKMPE